MPLGTVLGWVTGNTAGKRNNDKRRAENRAYEAAKDQWRDIERERKAQYDFQQEQYENQKAEAEESIRFQETGLRQQYKSAQEIRDYEFKVANDAYDKSVSQATNQKTFNQMAASVATTQQNNKLKDDLLGVLFEETQTILDYKANSTGLKMNRQNALIQADFKEAGNKAKLQFDMGSFAIQRNQKRSESKIEVQKAILEGMKAAGQLRARGTAGRSSAKSVLGVLAESGAMQANIANSLMYAEQGIDIGVAQLQDMFILDQAMVLASRDKALNDFDYGQGKLDIKDELDTKKIKATRDSIEARDAVVRQEIINARYQADLNAEAAKLLKPERMPELANPDDVYAEYDNPETEDYVELFFRTTPPEFPEYVPTRKPEKDDFKYSLGRENEAAANIGGALGLASLVTGGIGAMGGSIGTFGLTNPISSTQLTQFSNWLNGGRSIFGSGR
jgi:hypothetical protein|tara:strand:+ start:2872 stop:4215 length:1344 start_codon:yes stop_codon:yes gene_type:complete